LNATHVLSSIMPRAPRVQIAGGIYKVGSRGNGRRTLFHDPVAYELFLELLDASVVRFGWLCHTYCLMPNHIHLLIETTEANISTGTQWLKGRYAQWFNKRNGQSGHVFEGRFYGELVESDEHFLELVRYILNNPVRAGLCADPGEWRWSSYRPLVGASRVPSFLTTDRVLRQFGRELDVARDEFRKFVLHPPADDANRRQLPAPRPRGLTPGQTPVGTLVDQPKP
jgi:putative transposase